MQNISLFKTIFQVNKYNEINFHLFSNQFGNVKISFYNFRSTNFLNLLSIFQIAYAAFSIKFVKKKLKIKQENVLVIFEKI